MRSFMALTQKLISSHLQFYGHFTCVAAQLAAEEDTLHHRERSEKWYVLSTLHHKQMQQVHQKNIRDSFQYDMSFMQVCRWRSGGWGGEGVTAAWNDIKCQPLDRLVSCPGCLLPFTLCMLGQAPEII